MVEGGDALVQKAGSWVRDAHTARTDADTDRNDCARSLGQRDAIVTISTAEPAKHPSYGDERYAHLHIDVCQARVNTPAEVKPLQVDDRTGSPVMLHLVNHGPQTVTVSLDNPETDGVYLWHAGAPRAYHVDVPPGVPTTAVLAYSRHQRSAWPYSGDVQLWADVVPGSDDLPPDSGRNSSTLIRKEQGTWRPSTAD
jgi:hypothetical protein